jgi:hypothetical protein
MTARQTWVMRADRVVTTRHARMVATHAVMAGESGPVHRRRMAETATVHASETTLELRTVESATVESAGAHSTAEPATKATAAMEPATGRGRGQAAGNQQECRCSASARNCQK